MKADPVCPPFGPGSVDFSAFHAAAAKGHDLDEALAKATTPVTPLPSVPPTGAEEAKPTSDAGPAGAPQS